MAEPSVDAAPPKPKRKRRKLKITLIVIALIGTYFIYAHWPRPNTFTISPDTTVISGPVNPDGTINYTQYLADHFSDGVTPDNNGAVQLVRAFGPELFKEEIRAASLSQLGLTEDELPGPFFTSLQDYCEATIGETPPEDAYELLDRLTESPWTADEFPQAAEWLAANEGPLAKVIEGSNCPFIYFPIVSPSDPPTLIGVLLPPLGDLRDSAKALAARGMLRIGHGDTEGARKDLLAVHRLGRLVMRSPTVIQWLVGCAIEHIACRADGTMLTGGLLSAEDMRSALVDLQALPPIPHVKDAFGFDRFVILDCCMMFYRGGVQAVENATGNSGDSSDRRLRFQIDWDELLRRVNHWWDWQFACHQAETSAEFVRLHDEYEEAFLTYFDGRGDDKWLPLQVALWQFGGRPFHRLGARYLSDLLLRILLPSFGKSRFLYERARLYAELNQLAAAAMLHQVEHGEFPPDLSALAPLYPDEIPLDWFSNDALVYQRTEKGFRLYSVGFNMTDDGGAKNSDDIVVEFPLPPRDDE